MTPVPDVIVAHRARRGTDAIDQYSQHMTRALRDLGLDARYRTADARSLSPRGGGPPARWVLLQYNPFSYGRWGFAPWMLPMCARLRAAGVQLGIMVHEAWVPMLDARSALMGTWQRGQLRGLIALADLVLASTERLAGELGPDAIHLPVGSNIIPSGVSQAAARAQLGIPAGRVVALFGRRHPTRALDHAHAAIAALAAANGTERLIVLNLGVDAPTVPAPAGAIVFAPGPLAADALSMWLSASDLVLLPFTDGISTRRGTLMAAIAHGKPVVGLRGWNTDRVLAGAPDDAVTLTPAGDRDAFCRAVVELSRDPARLRRGGTAARRLYESRFEWSVAACSIAMLLAARSRARQTGALAVATT